MTNQQIMAYYNLAKAEILDSLDKIEEAYSLPDVTLKQLQDLTPVAKLLVYYNAIYHDISDTELELQDFMLEVNTFLAENIKIVSHPLTSVKILAKGTSEDDYGMEAFQIIITYVQIQKDPGSLEWKAANRAIALIQAEDPTYRCSTLEFLNIVRAADATHSN